MVCQAFDLCNSQLKLPSWQSIKLFKKRILNMSKFKPIQSLLNVEAYTSFRLILFITAILEFSPVHKFF